jgi:NADP-dependent 3-hydroxy acid dehydrogenase YdfG
MNVAGKVTVVTGGAGGIGAALAGRRARGRLAHRRPWRDLRAGPEQFGPVDLFFADAGVSGEPGIGDSDEDWQQAIDVNVLAHVRAARLLVPGWLARGSGYFVATASAAEAADYDRGLRRLQRGVSSR